MTAEPQRTPRALSADRRRMALSIAAFALFLAGFFALVTGLIGAATG